MQTTPILIYSLADAPPHILFHLSVSIAALLMGAYILLKQKGTQSHKLFGRTWAALMLAAAISSFFIQARGRLSLIHILSVVILIAIPYAIYNARIGRIHAHKRSMLTAYFSLCIAGLLTLLPYRMLGQLIFN